MNDDDRLTPEERAVIEAADRWHARGGRAARWTLPESQSLADAVAAYRKATAPPEPFEAYVGYYDDTSFVVTRSKPGGSRAAWRCTVTPTERVR